MGQGNYQTLFLKEIPENVIFVQTSPALQDVAVPSHWPKLLPSTDKNLGGKIYNALSSFGVRAPDASEPIIFPLSYHIL